jgi:superfamily II DNA or RNA helicase
MSRRFATQEQRELLVLRQGGMCAECGERLEIGDAEADHKISWADGGPTELWNLRMVCGRKCNKSKGRKSMSYDSVLNFSPGVSPRNGQASAFQAAWTKAQKNAERVLGFNLPTGYGKSEVIAGSYAIVRSAGHVSRLLIVCSSDRLRQQWLGSPAAGEVEGVGSWAKRSEFLGAPFGLAWSCKGHKSANQLAVTNHRFEAFVTSYAAIARDLAHYTTMLSESGSQWMIAADEFQYLGDADDPDQCMSWADAMNALGDHENVSWKVAASATPMRSDGRRLISWLDPLMGRKCSCGPECEERYGWDAHVTLQDAIKEGAILKPVIHVEDYDIAIEIDGEEVRLDTQTLREDGMSMPKYEVQKQLRYLSSYLSPMVTRAVDMLECLNARNPGAHQAMAFAMTCKHANAVSAAINEHFGKGYSDWIGGGPNGRSPKVNNEVIEEFMAGDLPFLVQVDKVGEGFDHDKISVGLILHLISSERKIAQQIGRLLRKNRSSDYDKVHIFVSSDSGAVPFLRVLIPDLEVQDGGGGGGGGDDEWPPGPPGTIDLGDLVVVEAEHTGTEIVSHGSDYDADTDLAAKLGLGSPEHVEALAALPDAVKLAMRKNMEELALLKRAASAPPQDPGCAVETLERQVQSQVWKLAGHLGKIYCYSHQDQLVNEHYRAAVRKQAHVEFAKLLHWNFSESYGRKVTKKTDDGTGYRAKAAWLGRIATKINDYGPPAWLRIKDPISLVDPAGVKLPKSKPKKLEKNMGLFGEGAES